MERAAGEALFVTEGIFDALSLEELGFPAVALCGAANTGRLMQALDAREAKPERVILAGDSDAAGQGMNEKLRENAEGGEGGGGGKAKKGKKKK